MDESQIRELVEGIKQGDEQAFEMLYQLSSKSVYFICFNFLGNEEDAKDVMQETYITAYKEIYQLNDIGKFVPWINQIAVNKCKKILLKKAPVIVDIENIDNQQVEDNENFLPEEYITQKEKRKLVMDIMRNKLSDIQYQTVILYYFNGLSVDEVADIMECPPGTVKYRLSIARGRIKEGVLEYEKDTDEKLYSMSTIPFLVSFFAAEVGGVDVPYIFPEIVAALTGGATAVVSAGAATAIGDSVIATAGTSQAGAVAAKAAVGTAVKTGLGTLKAKIAVGLAATAIAGAGAAAIIIHNNSDDKKEPTYYERFEERSCEELIEYFEDEYGYGIPAVNVDFSYDGEKTRYHREIYNEDETIWLQLEANGENDMPSNIMFIYCYKSEDTYREKWIESASFLCTSDEEKEELRTFMNGGGNAIFRIGEYVYQVYNHPEGRREDVSLTIFLNWDGGEEIVEPVTNTET